MLALAAQFGQRRALFPAEKDPPSPMPIEIKMPALSPTMEQGKLAKWLVKEGDTVSSGDILAEIETDKATMEIEAIDEGKVLSIAVSEGTEGVKVGTVIATISGDQDTTTPPPRATKPAAAPPPATVSAPMPAPAAPLRIAHKEDRVIASPLAKRLAAEKGVDLSALTGSGPNGRVVKADVEAAQPGTAKPAAPAAEAPAAAAAPAAKPAAVEMADETRALLDDRIPHTVEKLSGMRKTIARRLAQSMQTAPHIYLTLDAPSSTKCWRSRASSSRSTTCL
jgi:pyruvate dehydrogenase E2 component (dihydrolipoamide acetyltransferase)